MTDSSYASLEDPFYSVDQILGEEGLLGVNGESNTSVEHGEASNHRYRMRPDLTLKQKRDIVDQILLNMTSNGLPRGCASQLALSFHVHKSTISKIVKDVRNQANSGNVIDVRFKKLRKCGYPAHEYSDVFLQYVPLNLRTTVRSFVEALKDSHMAVYRLLKIGKLRSHTSSNHPKLTENHKLVRMHWVLQHTHPGTQTQPAEIFKMENVTHIDSKWFYLSPDTRWFILLPKEDDPYRCCESKRFKIKVMFMSVVSRPLYDDNDVLIHDGRFGIYPFVVKESAKKSSKNRPRGTMVTKAVQNINQEVIRRMIIDKVILDIMAKWPQCKSKKIFIQQDNARPHIQPNDPQFLAASRSNGFDIQLIFQPPQSPDLNVLDLGLFNSFQSIKYHSFPKDINELIEKVEEAYEWYEPQKIKHCWLQLQYIMVEILKDKEGNIFKHPHHGKQRLEMLRMLPKNVSFDQSIVDEAVAHLNERFVIVDRGIEGVEEEIDVD